MDSQKTRSEDIFQQAHCGLFQSGPHELFTVLFNAHFIRIITGPASLFPPNWSTPAINIL
jgi:hypothetical protein